jgi:hypothetical protein
MKKPVRVVDQCHRRTTTGGMYESGLLCNQCGAGANCSSQPIAAHQGIGHLTRPQLCEVISPLGMGYTGGDVVSLGSWVGNKWFCGDGPGPSIRGVVRGNVTPLAVSGVFTRAAPNYTLAGPG